ncbi:adenosine deaminase/editase [Nemania sp. FL0031]|nr:adenosine deaminase/editase [Nemania sp. FL0031]
MTVKSDLIASLVQHEFDKLPAKRKPVVRDNGLREWVPLSGIVAEGKDGKLTCLSLATGMKCLPSSKLSQAQGNVLHDWHAEILAIRAFNCFVLDECHALVSGSRGLSEFIRPRSSAEMNGHSDHIRNLQGGIYWHGQPFTWREDVLLHMYCSEAPCGDASMELIMASQADATPWTIPTTPSQETSPSSPVSLTPAPLEPDTLLPGRAYFSQLGIVRRKPSRGDAPPTLSKSCSDKLSLRQCTSLLSSLTSFLVSPEHAYISTLILPMSQYSAPGCRRAFSDGMGGDEDGAETGPQEARMAPLAIQRRSRGQDGGYSFRPFRVETTDLEFASSRRSAAILPPTSPDTEPKVKITPSNISTAFTASGRLETTLNGVLQGRKASEAHIRGASFASRRKMWGRAVEVAGLLAEAKDGADAQQVRDIQQALGVRLGEEADVATAIASESESESAATKREKTTYADVKNFWLLGLRRQAKEDARRLALKGWVRNVGDHDFVL